MAAATRVRETSDPDLQADRIADLGLPRGLHPDDVEATLALLRLAEGRSRGFEATIIGRVFSNERDDHDRNVNLVVTGNGHSATVLVGSVDLDDHFDPLTELPGRDHVLDRIDQALQDTLESDDVVAVLSIDVDRFKRVNDERGYSAADQALRTLAAELTAVLGPDDLVGRPGGDEFTIVCPRPGGLAEATEIGDRIRSLVGAVPIDSPLAGLTLSIGIALGGADRLAEDLLRESETALYEAKALGRDRWTLFDDKLKHVTERRVTADHRIRKALEGDRLEVSFQPMVDVVTKQVVELEALVRVSGTDDGPVDPGQMVMSAVDGTLVDRYEEAVLDRAAALVLALDHDHDHDEPPRMALNVSDRRVRDSRFPLRLARSLHTAGLPAERLRVEITPEMLGEDGIEERLLDRLRSLGVGVTIDGLEALPSPEVLSPDRVDLVKLGPDLVAALDDPPTRERARDLVTAILGRGVEVCALAVDTEADLEAVTEIGCRYVQGPHLWPPLSGRKPTRSTGNAI